MNLSEIEIAMALCCLPVLLSIYFFCRKKYNAALWLLFAGAFCIRFFMMNIDPFLNYWDERYHALVAKNMMEHPFLPMLRVNPVLPYDYRQWADNHIWVHKQPLFLWLMSISLKIFGIHTWAFRLPSALMGGLMVLMIYRIATLWRKDFTISYIAALLACVSYYELELTSGYYCTDHNDVAFIFFITAGIWAFCEYAHNKSLKWVILIGVFSGAAVLNKWLEGLLVFSGWGIAILADKNENRKIKNYIHVLIALLIALLISLPWQIYITHAFPGESKWEYGYNWKHITEVLGNHSGNYLFYLDHMQSQYGLVFIPFLFIGLAMVFRAGSFSRTISVSLLSVFFIIYVFFTFIVKTKMYAFTFPVCSVSFILIAAASVESFRWARKKYNNPFLRSYTFIFVLLFLTSTYCLAPWEILARRTDDNTERAGRIYNTAVYRSLNKYVSTNDVVFNCKDGDYIDVMFWQPVNAYNFCPSVEQLNDLISKGYKIDAFESYEGHQLPPYLINNTAVKVIDIELK